VFCALSKERVYGPFFFMETTITSIMFLDMILQFLIPQLDEEDQEECIHFQQDGALPQYLGEVREYLNTRFPGQRIDRAAPTECPSRSLNLTPLDFFLWDSLKIKCLYQLCIC
jgi:hypothetical protein